MHEKSREPGWRDCSSPKSMMIQFLEIISRRNKMWFLGQNKDFGRGYITRRCSFCCHGTACIIIELSVTAEYEFVKAHQDMTQKVLAVVTCKP